ncbi:MAG: CehA/McbA family metallohydrolase [Candidatus Hadarchaeum sp.]|uniref:CehA/McbA family metallohydrolase n=1 Tax=Candidatus Hadarchaeum sp. TaxID=2883567 RepID=UPI00317D81DC
MRRELLFQISFQRNDPHRNPYRLLPFMVPLGTKTIQIQYSYNKNQENIIDLGLFDPRGSEFLQGFGFRGWSGSARDHVIISEGWATPGYLAGPIYPGTWQILLGLYKITCPCFCEVHVTLSDEPVDEIQVHGPRPCPGLSLLTPGWLKGDLHCHSCHSDADGTVEELWAAACRKNLHFLAITDHNTTSHLRIIRELSSEQVLLLPGQEITSYKGHANAFGLWHWIDFRCTKDEEIRKVCDFVHASNGIFSLNHPKANGPNWEFSLDFDFDCLEVWHAFWQLNNQESLALWDLLLRQGRRIVAVGGSDAHPQRLSQGYLLEWLGHPTVWAYAEEVTPEGLIQAIKLGRVSISACPHGPFVMIELNNLSSHANQGDLTELMEGNLCAHVYNGDGLRFQLFSSKGLIAQARVTGHCWEWRKDINLAEQGYVRAELRIDLPGGKTELAALTNPIWYKPWLENRKGKLCKKHWCL